jgi:hypothetical protein
VEKQLSHFYRRRAQENVLSPSRAKRETTARSHRVDNKNNDTTSHENNSNAIARAPKLLTICIVLPNIRTMVRSMRSRRDDALFLPQR